MKATLMGLLLFSILAATPASAQKVYVEHDRDAALGTYETFAWLVTEEHSLADRSPLMHSRLKNAIEYQLTLRGMTENDEDPDIYVTYHGKSWEEIRLRTTSYGYSYGPGWYASPYWDYGVAVSTSDVYTYPKGTLIIDIYDARTKKVIWRASSSGAIPENQEKAASKIDRVISQMAKKWEKMKKKGL